MNCRKPYHLLALLIILNILFLQNSGCHKEYSFEGGDTARIIQDTMSAPPFLIKEFPDCALCNPSANLSLGHWSFSTGNSFLCGATTNSGFIGGYSKTDFTLFGPSACSIDTGLVISAFMPAPLDQDRFNLKTLRTAFYYYAHNASKDIFISMPNHPFSLTIDSYIYATGVCTGTFSGTVFRANGDSAYVDNGKFKVLVK